jgi:hypothetical protein
MAAIANGKNSVFETQNWTMVSMHDISSSPSGLSFFQSGQLYNGDLARGQVNPTLQRSSTHAHALVFFRYPV